MKITAVVLAAGESKRMGQPKMLMPWGPTTVFGTVIETLQNEGLNNIVVVTGGLHDELISLYPANIHYVMNVDYANGEMLTSVKVGLRNIDNDQDAALIVLGDQPQIQRTTVARIIEKYNNSQSSIIVPSYNMHRGHPWLVGRTYWKEIEQLDPPNTLRDFLDIHISTIDYIIINSPSILQDIDTHDDYLRYKP